MRRFVPLLLIVVGTALAAAFGARLGPGQLAWRVDLADGASALEPLAPAARWADWTQVGLWGWLLGVLLVVIGGVLARRRKARDTAEGAEGAEGAVAFPETVRLLRAEIARLRGLLGAIDDETTASELRDALDRLADERVAPVVASRDRHVARHGLVVFASWFGPFSEAERKLARCWSAVTDGHEGAAREALDAADEALGEALACWQRAEGPTTEAA